MKIKGWMIYKYICHRNYSVMLVLENGFAPYQHICTDPSCAFEDLWGRRQERKDYWEQKELELDLIGPPIEEIELPAYVFENYESKAYLEFQSKYFPEENR